VVVNFYIFIGGGVWGVVAADLDGSFYRIVKRAIYRAAGQGWPASTSEDNTPDPTVPSS